MSLTILKLDAIGLEETQNKLAGVQNGFDAAMRTATYQARERLRTRATKLIQETYDISKENLRMESSINVRFNFTPGIGAWASIIYNGRNIPLIRFGGSSPTETTSDDEIVSITRHRFKSTSPTEFKQAFIRTMKSGHTGIFERSNRKNPDPKIRNKSLPISELRSASIADMVGGSGRKEILEQEAVDYFYKRLYQNADAILAGHVVVDGYKLRRADKK